MTNTKIPNSWFLNFYDKMFLVHSMNECMGNFAQALQNEDIRTMENNLKLLDAAVKRLSKNNLAVQLSRDSNFV